MRTAIGVLAITGYLACAAASKRPIEFADVPRDLLLQLDPPISTAAQFDRLRAEINAATVERIRRGEQEALAYFILQSGSFTRLPGIEPSESARAFVNGVPADVRARVRDFLAALRQPSNDERMQWFARQHPSEEECLAAYEQAARFLQQKEGPAHADAYPNRGFSTDTHREANTAVLAALDAIRLKAPSARLNRVLIAGPGLEFAPRTGLRDLPPQSFQPYILLDGLLRRGMADADRVAVDCADISPLVIRFIQDFSRRQRPALLMPGAAAEVSANRNLARRHAGNSRRHGRARDRQ